MKLSADVWRRRLALALAALLLADLVAQAIRAVWNVETGSASDFVAFAGAARLLAAGSHCLYCPSALAGADAAFLGHSGPLGFYAPFFNPPLAAALLVPLTWLPAPVAIGIFVGIGFAALVLSLLVLVRGLGAPALAAWLGVASLPAALGLAQGQWDPLLLLALVGAIWALERKPLVAGLLLSALLLKPQLIWLVPMALMAMRRWRALGGLALGAGLWVVTTLVLVGPAGALDWLRASLQDGSNSMQIAPGIPGAVARLAGSGAGWDVFLVAAPLAVIACVLVARRARDCAAAVCTAVAVSLLLTPHSIGPDLVLLAPGVALAGRRRPRLAVAVGLALSLAWAATPSGLPVGGQPAAPLAMAAAAILSVLAVSGSGWGGQVVARLRVAGARTAVPST